MELRGRGGSTAMALDPVRRLPSGKPAALDHHELQLDQRLSALRPAWEAAYARWVVAADTTAVVFVVAAGAVLVGQTTAPAFAIASGLLVVVTTLLTTYLSGAWDRTVLGTGGGEYRRLV